MVERIRELLSVRQLTPTQFADSIGVARPIVSHILSGRNKPSLEVVQKIITAFPDLSLSWLLSGTGPMAAELPEPLSSFPGAVITAGRTKTSDKAVVARAVPSKVTEPVATSEKPSTPKITSQQPISVIQEPAVMLPVEPQREVIDTSEKSSLAETTVGKPSTQASLPLPKGADAVLGGTVRNDKEAATMIKAFAEPGKTIRRIVIFYHDGTFSDYQPEQFDLLTSRTAGNLRFLESRLIKLWAVIHLMSSSIGLKQFAVLSRQEAPLYAICQCVLLG